MDFKNLFIGAAFALGSSFTAAHAATVWATQIDVGDAGLAAAGWDAEAQTYTTERDNPGDALGAPDVFTDTEGGFFSIPQLTAVVLGFGTVFGGDANFFEVTFGCGGPTCSFAESIDVYALNGAYTADDDGFTLADLQVLGFSLVASLSNGPANVLGGATVNIGGPFSYLALVDTSSGGGAFDVDAVGVQPVPLPAAGLMLLAGLGSLGAMRRFGRRKS
ncbi:MAG: VPLPA-CTERM sorting domain-containing protein [Roseobacter sp.]